MHCIYFRLIMALLTMNSKKLPLKSTRYKKFPILYKIRYLEFPHKLIRKENN